MRSADVLVIDYGMGNLASVTRAFERCGASVKLSDRPSDLRDAHHLVLPGVGAFGDGMRKLEEQGWAAPLKEAVLRDGKPLLGICLGMQLLADFGTEGGRVAGLGLVPGEISPLRELLVGLEADGRPLRVPHVGWNEVKQSSAEHLLFREIKDRSDFYFTHSYYFKARDPSMELGYTEYGSRFSTVIGKGQIFGAQFHPEKSSRAGFRLLKNFVENF